MYFSISLLIVGRLCLYFGLVCIVWVICVLSSVFIVKVLESVMGVFSKFSFFNCISFVFLLKLLMMVVVVGSLWVKRLLLCGVIMVILVCIVLVLRV